MGYAAIASTMTAIAKAAGFVEYDYRRPFEEAPQGGADRHFQVLADNIGEVMPWLALPQNRRRTSATVRVAYFRSGGDAGGQDGGGDRLNVNARAVGDMLMLAQYLTNPSRYSAQGTGINRMIQPEFHRTADADRYECWDLTLQVEWEANENPRAAI